MRAAGALACGAAVLLARPLAAAPLGYLNGFGPKAYPVVALTWGVFIISIVVVVIMAALVLGGVLVRRVRGSEPIEQVPVSRGGNGLRWMSVGLGITGLVLIASLVWTVVVLAAVNGPPAPAPLTIEVTGQQWWWKARYLSADASRIFATADEIHIPVGQPVRIRLIGADVIHSFWVPKLSGKMDAIPGQINETWIEASRPGRYWGHCSEFCGAQHANMAMLVVAEPPPAFQAWWNAQLRPAASPGSAVTQAGEQNLVFHCGACHRVRGTDAGGTVAPDLTHVMSRSIIAGGVVPNTIGNLAGWIANPQSIKPATHMPDLLLSGPELSSIVAYVRTLQ